MAEEEKKGNEGLTLTPPGEERLSIQDRAQMLSKEDSVFFNIAKFEHAQRVATMLSKSDLLPEQFRGNIGNCFIALNLAVRMGIDPFMLAQSMYVVHGRPGFEAKLLIALLQSSGRFGPLYYKFEGSGKTRSCLAYAKDLKTGEVIEGPPVTWEMVEGEGWNKPKGSMPSKWSTMPDLMFRYRASTFFARVYDPGALMGMHTMDELEDADLEIRVGAGRSTSAEPPKPPGPTEEEVEVARKALMDAAPEKISAKFTIDDVDEFLVLTASGLRNTVSETIIKASQDGKEFWRAFAKWAAKAKATKKEEGAKVGEQPPAGQAPGQAGNPPADLGTQAPQQGAPNPPPPGQENGKKEAEAEKKPPDKTEPPKKVDPPQQKLSHLKTLTEKYHQNPKLYYAALGALEKRQVLDDKDAELVLKKMEEMEAQTTK